jgi:hypothetical protein
MSTKFELYTKFSAAQARSNATQRQTRFRIIPVQTALQVTVKLTKTAQHTYASFQKKKITSFNTTLELYKKIQIRYRSEVTSSRTYGNICILQHRMVTKPAIGFGINGEGLRPVHTTFE